MGAYTKWTEAERTAAREAVVAGKPPREVLHLFPGRTDQHVRNMMAVARRSMAGLCSCGGAMPDDPTYAKRTCPKCAAKAHTNHIKLRKAGTCIRCWKRPADGTLTWCATCVAQRRAEQRAARPETDPAKDRTWGGLLRWKSAGRMKHYAPYLPADATRVVDLFGGSAAMTIEARLAGFKHVVYNDVHPTLCDLVEVVGEGSVAALVAATAPYEHLGPDALLRAYRARASEPKVIRAALLLLLAHSVTSRDMHRQMVPAVCPVRLSYLARAAKASTLLRSVEVRNQDFAEILAAYDDPDTVFFVDPPFPGTSYYEHNLSHERFAELVDMLAGIRGRFVLATASSRFAAEQLGRLPYVWWRPTYHGMTTHRLLVASNYALPLERVHLWEFGLSVGVTDTYESGQETPRFEVETVSNAGAIP